MGHDGHIDASERVLAFPAGELLQLESGGALDGFQIAYRTFLMAGLKPSRVDD